MTLVSVHPLSKVLYFSYFTVSHNYMLHTFSKIWSCTCYSVLCKIIMKLASLHKLYNQQEIEYYVVKKKKGHSFRSSQFIRINTGH